MSDEEMPGTVDQDAGTRRKLRERPEHPPPTPSAQTVPRQVGAQRRDHGDGNARAQAQMPAPRQRAGAEQSGDHRYREATLVDEDPRKQKPLKVLEKHRR